MVGSFLGVRKSDRERKKKKMDRRVMKEEVQSPNNSTLLDYMKEEGAKGCPGLTMAF